MIVPEVGRKAQRGSSTKAIIATEAAKASARIIMSQLCSKIFLAYGQEQMVLFKL